MQCEPAGLVCNVSAIPSLTRCIARSKIDSIRAAPFLVAAFFNVIFVHTFPVACTIFRIVDLQQEDMR